MGPSTEYIVDFEELTRMAEEHGLVPFNKNVFEPYTSGGKTEYPASSNIISFDSILKLWQPKKTTRPITPEELELNGLYSTFIFQKK